MRNDSGIAFRPLIISRSNTHDKVRRVVVGFRNKVCFSGDVNDLILGYPFGPDEETQWQYSGSEQYLSLRLYYESEHVSSSQP